MAYGKPLAASDSNQEPLPPSWSGHVLIPVVQNILGGVAVGALGMIGVIAYTGMSSPNVDLYNAAVWSALAGGIVTSVVTIIRFFGDDIGIVAASYRAGQRSRDPQIAALELELRASQQATGMAQAEGGAVSAINKRQELDATTRRAALAILDVAFSGDSIARSAMAKRGMGQRDWERATRLLVASGAMDGEGNIVATTIPQALKAIDERVRTDRARGDKFTPAWQ